MYDSESSKIQDRFQQEGLCLPKPSLELLERKAEWTSQGSCS